MTVRSVVISFFIICFSFGMAITNEVNAAYAADRNETIMGASLTPFLSYGDIGLPSNTASYNETMRSLTTYNKPEGVVLQFDFFQNIKYAGYILGLLFASVFGFFYFLGGIGLIPNLLILPLTLLLSLNHVLALIYIVTGRTFIY